MPARPLRWCATPGCEERVPKGHCTEHARGTAAERGYGARWQKRRARYLRAHPMCSVDGCAARAVDVHHTPRRDQLVATGVRDPDADQYLRGLCHPHHSSITARGG